MNASLIVTAAAAISVFFHGTPAHAQLGGLGGITRRAEQVLDAKKKLDDLTFTEQEERQIGEEVSVKLRQRFGVVQDTAVHRYVTLVGTTLADQTDRAKLPWTFIVLDTDGVNAFASPGGFVHITRGALGLIQNEAELAGVLGHEIGHIIRKHTINAIRKSNAVKLGTDQAGNRSAVVAAFAGAVYTNIIENTYDRGDELDADAQAVVFAGKAGYAAGALGGFLERLAQRNKAQAERNGLFASHPETKERIGKIGQQAGGSKAALGSDRYAATISYKPTDITAIAVVADGAGGLAGSGSKDAAKAKEPPKKEEPKRGLGLGTLRQTLAPEQQSQQVSASGGARGVGPDRAAKGGGNPNLVRVSVSVAEVAAFRRALT
jgi:predicted Zn-dependent protease